jgi:DNA-binding XRE family transcriptional regulator
MPREPFDLRNSKNDYRLTGDILRLYRYHTGQQQKELAEEIGLSRYTVCAVENGLRKFSPATEKKVIEKLGLTRSKLILLYAIRSTYEAIDYV